MPRVCSSERRGEAEVKLAAMDVAGALRDDGVSEGRSGVAAVWRERGASGEASVRRRGRRKARNMVAVGACGGGRVGGEDGWKKCQGCTGGWVWCGMVWEVDN